MEKLMHYIWQHRLWSQHDLHTVDGQKVTIIDPGRINTDAGPDFFNAKIKIGGQLWAGSVEIHVAASDWHRHGHHKDEAYDSVILHVVDRDDAAVHRLATGELIPQMRMPCEPQFHLHYHSLVDNAVEYLPCASTLCNTESIYLADWIQALGYERIYQKADRVAGLVERMQGDWQQACYVTVARALGFNLNNDPFERLALSVPLRIVGRVSDSLTAIEALLFGQSGLLDDAPSEPYTDSLRKEYAHLAHRFGLKPPVSLSWRMARTRPANFPHRHIALLAAMLYGGFRMLDRFLDITTPEEGCRLFTPTLTGYWSTHTHFSPVGYSAPSLSQASQRLLVINVVVPVLVAYAQLHADDRLFDHAIELLSAMPAERNRIVELFGRYGLKARDAFESQAVIQLRRAYCEERKCLYCRIGHRMLSRCAMRREPVVK
ncbi:MAG: DUF2851 family protein [Bacteroidales bacterium]|nr:DUF2851 family protein [Bacteroidales bacterium]